MNAGFGVYIHWPFCQAKCPYCDFNSHVWREVDQAVWTDALVRELMHLRELSGPQPAETIFFGGGTPSLMAPGTVETLIEAVDRLWGLVHTPEITLEANPTSVEAAKFAGYASAGVNRVSIGVQALNDQDLKALGRLHSAAEARHAVETARATFDRISFDLIYARMGQSLGAWEDELSEALSFAADHLSLYQLTIEEGTRFAELHARGRLHVLEDGLQAEMYELTQAMTEAAGLPAYEVSNHAQPGAESQNNLIYWRGGAWAGAGPGAHGRLGLAEGRVGTETIRDPAAWLKAVETEGHGLLPVEPLTPDDTATEYLLMSLRLREGACLDHFAHLNGAPLPPSRINPLAQLGLLETRDKRIAATPKGRLVLNAILGELLA
ncbi:MAG: radical SAM family heme chaperone HemW [Pseudomonadota bacterium]